jgi:hypothetical protein
MNRIESLREQIDACRPGSDDLALSGLAELAGAAEQDRAVAAELDRSQRFDRAVISALHDVPVPGDLLERLLAGASGDSNADRALTTVGSSDAVVVSAGSAALSAPARVSRRWIIALATVAAVALIAVGVAPLLPRPGRDAPQDQLGEAAVHWHKDNSPRAEGWTAFASSTPPYPLLRNNPLRQRRYETAHGPAVVYDLAPPGRQALLFVVTTRHTFPVQTSPYTTITASGGLTIGAWQRGNTLYVLIISPDGHRLEDYVRQPRAA